MSNRFIALGYAFCWGIKVTLTKVALSDIALTTLLVIQLSSSELFLAVVSYLKDCQLPS